MISWLKALWKISKDSQKLYKNLYFSDSLTWSYFVNLFSVLTNLPNILRISSNDSNLNIINSTGFYFKFIYQGDI